MKASRARSVFGTPTLKQLTPTKASTQKPVTQTVGSEKSANSSGASPIVGTGVVGSMIVG